MCWHRRPLRSFLKSYFTRRRRFCSRWAGAWRRSTSRNVHAGPRSSFRRRHCPRVTHTHGCVPNSPPTTHHPFATRTMGGNIACKAFPGDAAVDGAPKTHCLRWLRRGGRRSWRRDSGRHVAPLTRRSTTRTTRCAPRRRRHHIIPVESRHSKAVDTFFLYLVCPSSWAVQQLNVICTRR